MIRRLFNPLKKKSFFIFGPRSSGKSTWLKTTFSPEEVLEFDLRNPETMEDLLLYPARFGKQILLPEHQGKTVIVDEVQKNPALLDGVHQLIEQHKIRFILTGSSARRLKQSGTNMLGGRAAVYDFFPFNSRELGSHFDLLKALERGLLPESFLAETDEEVREFLRSYIRTYIEKEIQQEQWVRNLPAFRRFLQVAGQMNGKIINHSKLGGEVGVDDKTVKSYFEILSDTLIGITLPGFHRSLRKQLRLAPKFYWIDPGIPRALNGTLRNSLVPATSAYGEAFEHFLILEFHKLSSLLRLDWKFSYLNTKDQGEIDLIIERPDGPPLLIEMKSKTRVVEADAKALETLADIVDPKGVRLLISQDPLRQKFGQTTAMFWREALEEFVRE